MFHFVALEFPSFMASLPDFSEVRARGPATSVGMENYAPRSSGPGMGYQFEYVSSRAYVRLAIGDERMHLIMMRNGITVVDAPFTDYQALQVAIRGNA